MRPARVLLLALALPAATPAAAAEWFADLQLGGVATDHARVTIERNFPAPTWQLRRTIRFDGSAVYGGRVGRWLDRLPWLGFAVQMSRFEADANDVTSTLWPVMAVGVVRRPARPGDFADGRLQPYAAFGPGLALYDIAVDYRPDAPNPLRQRGPALGLEAAAGLQWALEPDLGLVAEYRFTLLEIDRGIGDRDPVLATLRTHQARLGVRYRL